MLKIEQSISYILYCLVTLCSVFGKDRRGQSRPKKKDRAIFTHSLSLPPPHLKKQCNIQAFHIILNILHPISTSAAVRYSKSKISISLEYRTY